MAKYIQDNCSREGTPFVPSHENIIEILRLNGWFKFADAIEGAGVVVVVVVVVVGPQGSQFVKVDKHNVGFR